MTPADEIRAVVAAALETPLGRDPVRILVYDEAEPTPRSFADTVAALGDVLLAIRQSLPRLQWAAGVGVAAAECERALLELPRLREAHAQLAAVIADLRRHAGEPE